MDRNIPFKVLDADKSIGNGEKLAFAESQDKVIISITKETQTPAYSLNVEKITKEGNCHKIYYNIIPPDTDIMQLQVLTYKTVNVEIDKEQIGEPPYNFILDEYNDILNQED